jgi:hypothetical protein
MGIKTDLSEAFLAHIRCRFFDIHTSTLPIEFKTNGLSILSLSHYYESRCKCCQRMVRRTVLDKTRARWKLVGKLPNSHPLSDHALEMAQFITDADLHQDDNDRRGTPRTQPHPAETNNATQRQNA